MSWNSKTPKQVNGTTSPDEEVCECVRCVTERAGGTKIDAERAAYEQAKEHLVRGIEDGGYAITVGAIDADTGKRDYTSFMYTIGLSQVGVPELIAFGALPPEMFDKMATAYVSQVMAGEIPNNEPFEVTSWFAEDLPVYLVPVDREKLDQVAVQMADLHYEGTMFENVNFVQVVFQDENRCYPWQEGYTGSDDGWQQPVFGTPIKPAKEPTIQ
jgi:hypothetical protein